MWPIIKRENYFLFELYATVRMIGVAIRFFADNLLIQDKFCANVFNQTVAFCQTINDADSSNLVGKIKDDIFSHSVMMSTYGNLIQALPMFVWSLFVGSFLDRYAGGTKFLLLLGNVCDVVDLAFAMLNAHYFSLSPYFMLLPAVLTCFTGGMISFLTSVYRYIVVNTEADFRSIKFMIYQFCLVVALSFGTFIAGHVLILKYDSDQPRTYNRNYLIAFVLNTIAIVILCFLKSKPQLKPESLVDKENPEVNTAVDECNNDVDCEKRSGCLSVLSVLFDSENVKQTLRTIFKPRGERGRLQIMLLYLATFFCVTVLFCLDGVLLQFTQKVYHMTPSTFSNLSAIAKLCQMVLLSIASYFLIKVLQISEGPLIVWSIPSGILANLLIGTFLHPYAYYISIPVGSLFGLATISIRTKLSKVVPEEEIGKIFSFISTFESIVPFVGTFLFTSIFSATISFYPGLVYQTAAGLILLALVTVVFEELYCEHDL